MTPRPFRRLLPFPALLLATSMTLPAPTARAEESPFAEMWDALGGRPRGRLGIQVQPMTAALREYFDVDEETGVLVTEVEPKSPADAAGIEAGDVLLEVDSVALGSPRELIRRVDRVPEGDKIQLLLSRRGERKTIEVAPRGEPRVRFRDYEKRFRPWMDRTVHEIRKHLRELERRLEELERHFEAEEHGTERT